MELYARNLPGEPARRPCWACGAAISPGDNYCKNCGKGQDSYVPWRYKHWGVIVSALFGLGPFSLFFLWRSPVISRIAKIIYTGFILLLTWFAIYFFYRIWTFYQAMLGGM
ncbi:MAG: zinc ribbon domain-containing protein [Elusimicrobiota bacterium]